MTWNYRVVLDHEQDEARYTIREVYYGDDGRIESWTALACGPSGETWLECAEDHARMYDALGQPVIDVSSGEPVEVSDHRQGRGTGQRHRAAGRYLFPARDDDPVPPEEGA